jgi:hypothetical protein
LGVDTNDNTNLGSNDLNKPWFQKF